MTKSPRLAFFFAAAASLLQLGCAVLPEDTVEEAVGEEQQAVTVNNGLSLNGLSLNGLSLNGLSLNGLSLNGLSLNGIVMEQLEDPLARELLSFVVSCALPEGEGFDLNIEGVDYSFNGAIGLAPRWGRDNGRCDKECKSWVSACVISRVNYLGESVVISIRGKDDALDTTYQERQEYTHREATYFGDIFASPKKLYACLPPGAEQIPRVCGPSIDDCPIDVLGECEDLCGRELSDGAYHKCEDPSGKRQKGAVTVFLKP